MTSYTAIDGVQFMLRVKMVGYWAEIPHYEIAELQTLDDSPNAYKVTMRSGKWTEIDLDRLQDGTLHPFGTKPEHVWHDPDWGHGPNPLVKTYTEDQIRQVMEEHYVNAFLGEEDSPDYDCGKCSNWTTPDANHIIEELRKL